MVLIFMQFRPEHVYVGPRFIVLCTRPCAFILTIFFCKLIILKVRILSSHFLAMALMSDAKLTVDDVLIFIYLFIIK